MPCSQHSCMLDAAQVLRLTLITSGSWIRQSHTPLGKGVTTLKFWGGNSTKCNLNASRPSQASSGAIASDGQPQAALEVSSQAAPVIITDQPKAVPVPTGDSSRELRKRGSDASDDAAAPDKSTKRRKTLSDTLVLLRTDIKDAVANDMWWSDNTWNHDTVAVLLGDLLQVIANIVEDKKSGLRELRHCSRRLQTFSRTSFVASLCLSTCTTSNTCSPTCRSWAVR